MLKKTRAYARTHLLVTSITALVTVLILFVIFQYTLPKVALFCDPPVAEQSTVDNGSISDSKNPDSAGSPKLPSVPGDIGLADVSPTTTPSALPGTKGDTGKTGKTGKTGATGATGAKGASGSDGICTYVEQIVTNILPSRDNIYTLGNTTYRWKELYLGPNSLNMIDEGNGNDVKINVSNGILALNGADSLRFGNIKFTATGIASDDPALDITIGEGLDTGFLKVPTGIKFGDNTTMTTKPTPVPGPTGPAGPRGPQGPQGPPGNGVPEGYIEQLFCYDEREQKIYMGECRSEGIKLVWLIQKP